MSDHILTNSCNCPNGSYGQKHSAECLSAEIERLRAKLVSVRARCLNLAQWLDKGCDPKHGATEASFIALFAKEPSDEPSGCPEHGMEHFFEGMCIKCGVVPAVKSREPIICDRCGQDIAGKMVHECDGIL